MKWLLLIASLCLAADPVESDWRKVMELTRGTEVRIAMAGKKSPVEAKVDSINEEAIVIVLKDEQRSILVEEIERLDYRNLSRTKKLTKDSRVSTDDTSANPIPPGQRLPGQSAVPRNMSSTNTVTLPSKAPWEPLYKRAPAAKKP
jgi:hypothetical protein